MAYSEANPPQLISQGIGGKGKLWMYKSTDDENAFDDTDYITNADVLGMTTGDAVIAIDSTNGLTSIGKVTVDADGNGTLSAFTAIA
jgi:hypothetical protein